MITTFENRKVEPDITVVEVIGRLHLGNTLAQLEFSLKWMIDNGCRKLVVDLAMLKFIDSAGIGMLIGINGQMEQAGGQFRVAGSEGIIARSFEIVHMNRIVALDADVATACNLLGAV